MTETSEDDRARLLEWTPELVARFWDNAARASDLHNQYFTFQVGREIVNFLKHATVITGRQVLDYGAGPGYLVAQLLECGALVTAADYSPESVRRVNERFEGRHGWQGGFQIQDGTLGVKDETFDLITCVETIEHMFEGARRDLLKEFRRVLKPGGKVLFTTPNEEDLSRSMVFCPQCAVSFHNMQHLCAWNSETLSSLLVEGGFCVEFCRGIDLARWGQTPSRKLIDHSFRDIARLARDFTLNGLARMGDAISPRPFPNGRAFTRLLPTYRPRHLVAMAVKA
jgi:2-polyprenyl-3-methyl-5-hydroxy-6-metoxy-1,4-benzoquinol methylase